MTKSNSSALRREQRRLVVYRIYPQQGGLLDFVADLRPHEAGSEAFIVHGDGCAETYVAKSRKPLRPPRHEIMFRRGMAYHEVDAVAGRIAKIDVGPDTPLFAIVVSTLIDRESCIA